MKAHHAGKAKKFHGVGYHARTNRFVGRVSHNGKPRGKTFRTATEAAAAVDSFSHYVEKQNRPRNFKGTPKKIDWPEMPWKAAGGHAALEAQRAHKMTLKKLVQKRKKVVKRKK